MMFNLTVQLYGWSETYSFYIIERCICFHSYFPVLQGFMDPDCYFNVMVTVTGSPTAGGDLLCAGLSPSCTLFTCFSPYIFRALFLFRSMIAHVHCIWVLGVWT